MPDVHEPYYRPDLALVHHRGFGFHADRCAPGILARLEGVRERDGLVVELGCGSGLLTKYLVDAGHRVIATDGSPAMIDIAREYAPGAREHRVLRLPDDPIPDADAIVSVGHVLSYLPTEDAIDRALGAAADALRPGGVFAIDLADLEWARARPKESSNGRFGDDWAIVNMQSAPSPDRYVREMAVFVRNEDGSYRRDGERHDNVLIDTARVPALLAMHGVDAEVAHAFGSETLPDGLLVITGTKRA